jgi:N-acetylmuramoyl-L-alanine amidase
MKPKLIAMFAGALALAPGLAAAADVAVTAARIAPGPEQTRFTLELSGPLSFQTFTLPDPYRAVIDLPRVTWRILPATPPPNGLISGFRFGAFKRDTARVVLDLKAPARIASAVLQPPSGGAGYRLVVELERESEREAVRAAAPPPPPGTVASIYAPGAPAAMPPPPAAVPAPPQQQPLQPLPQPPAATAPPPPQQMAALSPGSALPPLPQKKPPPRRADAKFVVAIDPGHGGVDPGTHGRSSQEKHVTLEHARELRRQLDATKRFRGVLTRDADLFVGLRERIAIARAAKADFFISLHADANDVANLRGASVYTLSETASDKEAEALAAKENKADLIAGADLRGQSPEVVSILIDLAQRETMNQSALFAQLLVAELAPVVSLIKNTHRFAGFAVLKAPDTPAVLIEMGHLSNPRDEAELKDPAHRRKFAAAVVRALENYAARAETARR